MSSSPSPTTTTTSDILTAYSRSANLAKQIRDVGADDAAQVIVKPHWLAHRPSAFWYRRRRKIDDVSASSTAKVESESESAPAVLAGRRRYEFVIVDAAVAEAERVERGTEKAEEKQEGGTVASRLAFDHDVLAEALRGKGVGVAGRKDCEGKAGSRASADKKYEELPFTWIDVVYDGNGDGEGKEVIRFRAGNQKWQFRCTDNDGTSLTEYDGDIQGETLQPLRKERVSDGTNQMTKITFMNRTKVLVNLLWIDFDGETKYYAKVEPGRSRGMMTFIRHVWRVTNTGTEEPIASFIAQENETTAVIEEGMTAAEPVHKSTEKEAVEDPERSSLQTGEDDKPEEKQKQQPLRRSFVKDYNLWVRETDGQETQLSTGGTKENPFDGYTLDQSPDDRFVFLTQYVPEQEHIVYTVQSSPKNQLQPQLKQFQCLKPGDRVRVDRPRMFDLVKRKEIETDDSLFQNAYEMNAMGWSADKQEYRIFYNQRGHQVFRIIGINTEGNVRVILEECTKTFIDYSSKMYWYEIKDSNELIWASERDGWNHLYLFDLETGKMKNRITSGDWVVRSVDKVDEEKRQLWVRAYGVVKDQDPYYAQLVRINLDGSDFIIVTEGDGTHTWTWSPDRKYLVDTWSRVDQAPQNVLRQGVTGKVITKLEDGNLEKLLKTEWTLPERFATPGRDGKTMIYGIIIRPSEFDQTKKYPIIEKIYAGPTDISVPKSFSLLLEHHELAELGFVVVQIDGMGTNWRSKPFHDVCYKNLKDAGLPDRIAWMKVAAETRPWMDLERVGIYGGSAGGANAMAALLWHGDFYKAAAADCGCHDNRMDKIWWNEQWMGWPVDQSYEESSNVVHAGKLRGKLMLTVGELDDNVDPASTMQVVNALNEAGKDYDLLFVPGRGHGVGSSSQYALRRQKDFFVRHLIGVEPPNRNTE